MIASEEVGETLREKLLASEERWATEIALLTCLDGHRITTVNNLGYYRSGFRCSCAAEWWAGNHTGDPSSQQMWDIHRAEVIAAFMSDREVRPEGEKK